MASYHGTIEISNAGSLDAGFYQCVAENMYGVAVSNKTWLHKAFLDTTSISVDVPAQLNATEGMPFHIPLSQDLKCFPKPKFSWELAKDRVDESPKPFSLSKRAQISEKGKYLNCCYLPFLIHAILFWQNC